MLALLALLALAPLLYIPGALLARALTGDEAGSALDRTYARVTLGALLNGWLAFTLGQAGAFSIWLHLALVAAICVAAALVARGRGRLTFAPPRLTRPAAPDAALVAVLLLFGLLVAHPFEVVIGVRDAGVYANAGLSMARTGSLVRHDPLVAQIAADQRAPDAELASAAAQAETNFLGVQNPSRFIATRLRAAGFFIYEGDLEAGVVTPQGLHLFSAWVGLLAALLGLHGGLLAPGLMGLLGVWSVGMLGRRLAGPWAGVLAALLLALNAAQVWFSRYSTTESTAQFLTFAGLAFFAALTEERLPTAASTESADGTAHAPRSTLHAPTDLAAVVAGLAFGQLALARIDFFLVLAPVALYLLYRWLTRRWRRALTLLGASLALMLAHAALQFTGLARAYFFDTLFARLQDYAVTALVALPFLTPALRETFMRRPCSPLTLQPCPPIDGMPPTGDAPLNLARIGGEIGLLVLLVVLLLALRRWGRPLLLRAEGLALRAARPLLALAAAATILLGGYAYLVRPQILSAETLAALPSCLSPSQLGAPQRACLALQGYVGAPVAAPPYVDPLAASIGAIPQILRGREPATPAACAALRDSLLPPEAAGRTVPELIDDGLLDPAAVDEPTLDRLNACDRLVLRSQFANSQANLVRVGWYASPLGIALAFAGLALLWLRPTPGRLMFLAVALLAGFVFIRLTYGTSDQHYIYILRRYVPQVYPALAIAAAVAITALASLARRAAATGPQARAAALLLAPASLAAAQLAFLAATLPPIARHTEYGGALDQIGALARRFQPGDVLLLRGGAPSYAEARDLPDVLATPLALTFGVDALTVKSRDPGRYADQLARYVREWQARGRTVYLASSASGALQLPGLALEPAGTIELSVDEFEQLTNQKPRNVQRFQLAFALYRIVPDRGTTAVTTVGPADYASQLDGLYRAETIESQALAWTDGDALLRLELPPGPAPAALALSLGSGRRPAALGPASACVSVAVTASPWTSEASPAFGEEACFTLGERPGEYTVPLPADVPHGAALLVRIQSPTWIPARDDPQGRDPRRLGVQFGGLTLTP